MYYINELYLKGSTNLDRDIFKYLEKDYKELYSLGEDINNLVFTSPHSVILKSRVFIETLSKEIATFEKMDELNSLNLAERLSKLKFAGLFPSEINDYFFQIRINANKVAHEAIEGELQIALSIHRYIFKITCWFIETYIDYNFNAPLYKDPLPKSNKEEKKEESNLLIRLMGKVDSLINSNKKTEEMILEKVSGENNSKEKNVNVEEDSNNKIVEEKEEVAVNKEVAITKDVTEVKKECLIQELSKLKESSKEAVEGLNTFSPFKKYMHVNRDAQNELQDIIFEAEKKEDSQLILVCGSVGDGKSHIISYFKSKYPEIMNNFKLHNDATESLEPNKTSMDTLNDILDNFSDEKIDTSTEKLILAINLGTLNNFIDSDYGKRFTKLQKYVENKKILEKTIVENKFDSSSNIQFINFSDYNLYTLKDGKVQSKYIKELINKITNPSEVNDFYNSYKENCSNCKNKDKCPIKANYELISEDSVQNAIVDLLVQCIIKKKIIISTRSFIKFYV